MTTHELLLEARTNQIRSIAQELGFLNCGFSKSRRLDEEENRLASWLEKDRHGEMGYMANHFEVRLNPELLLPGAKTIISLAYNYYIEPRQDDPDAPKISTYAYGRDYHKVVKKLLKDLVQKVQESLGNFSARVFVDSAPILEKKWAQYSGLGWVGKHTNLISKEHGSFFFLCEIVTDLECMPDEPFVQDHCGTCTRCIDACPTDAIVAPYELDGSRCISYLTIELKNSIPNEFASRMEGWAFGCDICQQVCPWNRFSLPHEQPQFNPKQKLMQMSKKDWKELTKDIFDELFDGSPVKRTGYEGLMRNVKFLE